VDYAFPWDALVLRLKFSQALDLADTLADAMANALLASALPPPELLLPMPLSTQRLRERGFNQAWELTRRLGRRLSLPADAKLLLRIKDTPHQLALPEDRRAANVRGAFAVEPLRRQAVVGQHVALVDDVMTTGATAAEAARVLMQAGAASVVVWVAARTPRPRDR
jgi:ComF family protein